MKEKMMKIAMYSHDTMGLGHMRRNLLIAQELRARLGATVLMISGAWEAGLFALPAGIDCVTLPALQKETDGGYAPRRLCLPYHQLIHLRAQTLEASLRAFEPDLLVVDKVPRGVGGELVDALQSLRRHAKTRCVLGLRDILDEGSAVRREWQAQANEEAVRDYYDQIWVYGDSSVYDVVGEYGFSPELAEKVRYCGYLNRRPTITPAREQIEDAVAELRLPAGRLALCMVGGGQDGAALARAFARARLPEGMNGLIVTGPFMPEEVRRELGHLSASSERLRVIEFVNETAALLLAADRVVTMGGYNSVCEALSYGVPALVVPRVRPRREQLVRAEHFAKLGLLEMLHPDDLTPEAIARWLEGEPLRHSGAGAVDFKGLERLPELAKNLCAVARPQVSVSVHHPSVSHVAQ
jgi:predicted glycosyltransferase